MQPPDIDQGISRLVGFLSSAASHRPDEQLAGGEVVIIHPRPSCSHSGGHPCAILAASTIGLACATKLLHFESKVSPPLSITMLNLHMPVRIIPSKTRSRNESTQTHKGLLHFNLQGKRSEFLPLLNMHVAAGGWQAQHRCHTKLPRCLRCLPSR